MSNQAVGNVYQTIIDEVINSSRVDFEESGVEESVLEELRQGWQQKLTQLDVARFPWDPRPEPTPAVPEQPVQSYVPQPPVPVAAPVAAHNGTAADGSYIKEESGVTIKEEPGTQAGGVPQYPAYGGMDNSNSVAANRAAQQLQAQYGIRAAGSINAIQDRMGQQPQQSGQTPQPPAVGQAQQQNYKPAGQQIQNNQTDGAGDADDEDFEGILLRRSEAGTLDELGRVDIDRMMHARMAAQARSMEGGGLMLPLKEATKTKSTTSRSRKGKGVGAFDGGDDDDEEDDEDAINSDLDDPDEDHEEDEVDDEGLGHIMLCMYDKVQRVKNKWKCTLKDGVLTVNGKEYVFHKATGEYEW
ncbi:hypothetical protein NLG97_g3155 [Lecanicillium saksenae]|uniref:Uncharacterized protein n=1 Tax=Lecanicillium saksenae TaxID=468837 RepID=A0ACC1R256_9HYPO|nr:hypothetical protein NLG97_g3155 [Lecanicillium saksenae]